MGKYCQQCGVALEDKDLFCCICGARQATLHSSVKPVAPQNNISESSTVHVYTEHASATAQKKRTKPLLIGGIILVITLAIVVICLVLPSTSAKREPPFFGVERGDSIDTVEKRLGTPDDFQDNGLRNFDYYYEVEFLDMDGYLEIHFELDKVDALYFHYYSTTTIIEYEDAVDYYIEKYGEPDETGGDYYSTGEYTFWLLNNNTGLRVKHYPGTRFSEAHLEIAIYS